MMVVVLFSWWYAGRVGDVAQTEFLPETLVVRSPSASFDLTPTHDGESGVFTDSAFVLRVSEPLEKRAIEQSLVIEPRFDYTLRNEDDGQFLITPKAPLRENVLYHFVLPKVATLDGGAVLHPFSWAYQTQGPFSVEEVFPADTATEVSFEAPVEITFSSDVWDAAGAEKFFHITPEVAGVLSRRGRTLVFTPSAPLPQRRIFTVTLDAGFALRGGERALGSSYTWSFETGVPSVEAARYYDGGAILWKEAMYHAPQNFRPGLGVAWHHAEATAPEFRVWKMSEGDFVQQMKVVLALPAWSLYGRTGYAPDTARWETVQEFGVGAVQQLSEAGTDTQVVLPAGLERGWYALQADYHGERQFALLQVSNIAAFSDTTQTDNVFWAHNVVSDQALGGARVSFADFPAAAEFILDDRGFARWRYPDAQAPTSEQAQEFVMKVVDAEGSVFYVPQRRGAVERVFTAYVSVDAGQYAPGSAVGFWGVAAPRAGDAAPHQVRVQVVSADVSSAAAEGVGRVFAFQDVPLDKNFVFSGQLTLPTAVAVTDAVLQVLSDDQILTERPLRVGSSFYPDYAPFTLQLTTPERVVISGDVVDVAAQATFIDGSPVAGLELEDDSGRVVGKTDDSGNLKTQVQFFAEDIQTPSLQQTYTLRPHDSQFRFLTADVAFTVFQSDLLLDVAESKVADDTVELTLEARRLDPARAIGFYADDTALYAGLTSDFVPDQAIVIEVSYLETQKRADGTFFDVEAQAQKPFLRTTQKKTTMDARRVITDTAGKAQFTFPYVAGRKYDVTLQARDDTGRILVHTRPVFGDVPAAGEVGLVFGKERYSPGSRLQAGLVQDGVPLAAQAGDDFLFLRTQADYRSETVTDQPDYRFEFADQDAPYTDVTSVWYDGFDYRVFKRRARVDYRARALTVKTTLDKQAYAPGDTVRAHITTQTFDGLPAAGTVIVRLASAADSRVAAIRTVLDFATANLFEETSYVAGVAGLVTAAEEFDSGDVTKVVQTNVKGEADVSFEVPDAAETQYATGSWRMNVVAVFSSAVSAGPASSGPVSGFTGADFTINQPVDVELAVPEFFLRDDHPTLRARVVGDGFSSEDTVTFQASIPDLDYQLTWHAAPVAWSSLALPPDLPVGSHDIILDVTVGEIRKQVQRTLRVVDSPYAHPGLRPLKIEDGKIILPAGGSGGDARPAEVRLRFIDARYAPLVQKLFAQAWPAGGDMSAVYAAYLARVTLRDYFPDIADELKLNADIYQNHDGGLALAPGGQSQVSFSARVAAEDASPFDRSALKGYFWGQVSEDSASLLGTAYAYYGLASLGEPVLPAVVHAFSQDSLSHEERIVYALAAERMGAGELAYKQYAALRDGGTDAGGDDRVGAADSALFLLLAARVDRQSFAVVTAGMEQGIQDGSVSALDATAVIRGLLANRDTENRQVVLTLHGQGVPFDLQDGFWVDMTALANADIVLPDAAASLVTPFLLVDAADGAITTVGAGETAAGSTKQAAVVTRARMAGGRAAQVVAPFEPMEVRYTVPGVTASRELTQNSCVGVFEAVPSAVTALPTAAVIASDHGRIYTCSPVGSSGSFGYDGYARLPGDFIQVPGLVTDSQQQETYATERDILVVEP